MKRVIEINKEVYEEITCDEGCGLNELTRIIGNSKPLNEVLDKIINEITGLSRFALKDVTTQFVNVNDVINIIEAHKESEE